jgi:zinc and cadmium transporter
MAILTWIIASTLIVSLLSLIGVITLGIKDKFLNKIILLLVGLSAGALLGGALLHLIPEALEELGESTFLYVILGFILFFIIERVLHWRHCHQSGKCDVHTFTYMNLIGDGIHNFIDGMIIAASYIISINLGIITTIAIITHELPQEIGDFGVLIYGGFRKTKALLFNFLSALTAVIGALVGYFISKTAESFSIYLLPFAAGGFIYIAASDLIPELHKEADLKKSALSFVFFAIGIALMFAIKVAFEG